MNISEQLAKHLNDLHFGGNWTSVDLESTLSNIPYENALKKVDDSNSILALTYHINYYVLSITKVLLGGELDSKDKFSFDHPEIASELDWIDFKSNVFSNCNVLVSLIQKFPPNKLDDNFAGKEKYGSYMRNFMGLIEHSHYHLGQISLLSKLVNSQNITI